VPSTRASLRSADLVPDERFAVFLEIFAHARSASAPLTSMGSDYQQMFSTLALAWEAGEIGDLPGALARLDVAIDVRNATADIRSGGATSAA